MKVEELYMPFFKHFDAYYNPATGMVENNAASNGDQQALYNFRKCMAQEGFALGGAAGSKQ